MTFSGSVSPTFTESNSRSAMAETLISVFPRTTREGRIRLLHNVTGLVGDDVLGHDDVGAVPLPNRVHIHVAVELVARMDRLAELQHLIDLDDLHVRDADVGTVEECRLRLIAGKRNERQTPQQASVAHVWP